MIKFSSLIGGIFALFTLGWVTMVAIPYIQLDKLQPEVDKDTGDVYPVDRGGVTDQGRAVYIANGCVNCHTQQISPGYAGTEIARKWGIRQTVARDYLYDSTMLAGWYRMGPDLTNVGKRRDDAMWHYKHLYRPRSVSPGSLMPPYPFLFEKRRISGAVSHDAVKVMKGSKMGEDSYEIVPSDDARALVGYLMSLNRTHPLPESPNEVEEEKKPEAAAPAVPAVPTEGAAPASAGVPASTGPYAAVSLSPEGQP